MAEVIDKQSIEDISFENCLIRSEVSISGLNLPANRVIPVVNTDALKVTKIIADDANVVITCSRLDRKMTLIKSVPPDLHLIKR